MDENIQMTVNALIKVEQTENCILEICCNPTLSMQKLAHRIHHDTGLSAGDATMVAQWIKDNYDLAPKDSLTILRTAIAANARDYNYE